MDKREIRKNIKGMRLSLTNDEKQSAASKVFSRLEDLNIFQSAKNILIYYSLPDELPTVQIIEQWCDKKKLYLPRVAGDDLEILPYHRECLNVGSYDIEEPTGADIVSIDVIDLVIVPAVAFDRRGYRLGRGKGYYDRLLSCAKVIKVGVGYDFQLMESVPVESHDVPMDIVITPSELLYFA